uniref:Uncharacterized protein n=1 Tax=Cacopsylla melanoneura TaxID=428564 RepID=A0A8D9E7P9_9HEMI
MRTGKRDNRGMRNNRGMRRGMRSYRGMRRGKLWYVTCSKEAKGSQHEGKNVSNYSLKLNIYVQVLLYRSRVFCCKSYEHELQGVNYVLTLFFILILFFVLSSAFGSLVTTAVCVC